VIKMGIDELKRILEYLGFRIYPIPNGTFFEHEPTDTSIALPTKLSPRHITLIRNLLLDHEIADKELVDRLFNESEQDLTQEQKDELARIVFFNPHVLQRIEEAENATEEDEITSYEEYLKYKREVFE
jgi:hypothetical protein